MRWRVFDDGKGVLSVRAWDGKTGKLRRLPIEKYRHLKHSREELEKFVLRLNAPLIAKEKVAFKHAFIDEALLDEYREFLYAQVPSEAGAKAELSYLKKYFLNYFIGKLDLQDPLEWFRVHETKWANFLITHKDVASAKAKRDVVNAANRFVKWLHKQRPSEIPLLEFTPITRAKYKEIDAKRELDGEVKERKFIPAPTLKRIIQAAPEDLKASICLGAYYGLRRAECVGVKPGDVKNRYLACERQLRKLLPEPVYGPLKGRKQRKVDHWFASPAEAYKWVEQASKYRIHPCTVTDRWNELMQKMGLDYDFHDLRHTFITNAVQKYPHELVRLAAGHEDIGTTMQYVHDTREEDDAEFKPTG